MNLEIRLFYKKNYFEKHFKTIFRLVYSGIRLQLRGNKERVQVFKIKKKVAKKYPCSTNMRGITKWHLKDFE